MYIDINQLVEFDIEFNRNQSIPEENDADYYLQSLA